MVFSIPLLLLWVLSTIDTGHNGVFTQKRVGQHGRLFTIYKLRTYKNVKSQPEVTKFGSFLRKSKLDELPQLLNVLIGDMSFVGPRPDVLGFADTLLGEDKIILSIKPGITGLATLYFHNEEILLNKQSNPQEYNRNIIWPKKVELNKLYISQYSFHKDLEILFKTII